MSQHNWIKAQKSFNPPYCQNKNCEATFERDGKFFVAHGWVKRKRFPVPTRRYRCKWCGTTFSYTSFKLHFRERTPGFNSKILRLHNMGVTYRDIGRALNCSEHMVRQRIRKMAKWAFLKHTLLTRHMKISEPVAYDGIENFAGSQYDPNHIQVAIGSNSLFLYDFNFAPLNRKGRMTEAQKRTVLKIESEKGRYPPSAIRTSTKNIIKRLCVKTAVLDLRSDEHFQYRRVVKHDLKNLNILHQTTSSKAPRNGANQLFPVNHVDALLRAKVAAFTRETISFSKTHSAMVDRFVLFMIWKNYLRPQFVNKSKRRPFADIKSPFMNFKMENRCLKFHEFFDVMPKPSSVSLNNDWKLFYRGEVPYPRSK